MHDGLESMTSISKLEGDQFFLFIEYMGSYRNADVRAYPLSLYLSKIEADWFYGTPRHTVPLNPWPRPQEVFVFGVRTTLPFPDVYASGTNQTLYSRRILEILGHTSVRFETFEVRLYDQKTKQELENIWGYKVLRLLDRINLFEYEPDVTGWRRIRTPIVPNPQPQTNGIMARETKSPHIIIIDYALKDVFEKANLTGFKIQSLAEYEHELNYGVQIVKDGKLI